jgi:protein TonB
MPGSDTGAQRFGGALSVSLATHVGMVLLFLFIMSLPAAPPAAKQPFQMPTEIVWLDMKGPGGGGGGGGNKSPEPVRKAELPGKEKITVPAAKPPKLEPEPPKEIPKPPAQLTIPAQTMATGVQELPGAISNLPTLPTPSQGPGTGNGAGTGTGTGIGPGRGSGLGDGEGGGTGGGPYRPGSGVEPPRLLREVKATYTEEARRRGITGDVLMEVVVRRDGSVGDAHVLQGLGYGLEERAISAVKQWRFAPAMRKGVPVDVLVEVAVEFTLR